MTTNYIRPTISYENVSLLKGGFPSHSEDSNNDQTINLIPLVQDFSFNFSTRTEDILTLSEKFYAKRLNTYDVDVNLSVTAFETLSSAKKVTGLGFVLNSGLSTNLVPARPI